MSQPTDQNQFNWYGYPNPRVQPPAPAPAAPMEQLLQPTYAEPVYAEPSYTPPPFSPPQNSPYSVIGPAPRKRRRGTELLVTAVVAGLASAGVTAGVLASHDSHSAVSPQLVSVAADGAGSKPAAAGTSAGPVAGAVSGGVDWPTVAKAVQPSVVSITVRSGQGGGEGSGVLLDTSGRVLTNNHVVEGAASGRLDVALSDGRSFAAEIVGTDASTDLAVIKLVGATKLIPATLGDSSSVRVGSPVMALGNPLGLASTVTTGIVSALNRPVSTGNAPGGPGTGATDVVVTNAIQTDAAVNPGNSGGALVDTNGRVVGIPSSIASLGQSLGSQNGSIGLGFAIPINEAKDIADQLISKGTADHPFLGVGLSSVTVKQGSASRSAARIDKVNNGMPAQKAGLQAGDAVIAVDGELVNSSESLIAQIRERRVGTVVRLTVIRGSTERTLSVSLTQRPTS
jgi:putative serine protease PepD